MKTKSLIVNILLAVLCLMMIIFLALPMVGKMTGFDTFQTLSYLKYMGAGVAFIYVAPLFIMLASIVLLVFSVLNILGDVKVLKCEKFLKVSRIVALVASVIVALFALLAVIFIVAEGASPAVGLILNLIFAFATVAGTSLVLVWGKKA